MRYFPNGTWLNGRIKERACIPCDGLIGVDCSVVGANASGANLRVEAGYWRTFVEYGEVVPRACHTRDACMGGGKNASDLCRRGHEGPLCEVSDQSLPLQHRWLSPAAALASLHWLVG